MLIDTSGTVYDYQAKATGDYEKPSGDPTMDALGIWGWHE